MKRLRFMRAKPPRGLARWAIPLLQCELKIPLSIDSPNPRAMEAALKIHKGRALLNSVTGEKSSLDSILPIIREFKPPKPS
ncbi:MAG: dihydropteroate synthase [Candidatus Aminicenantales bacterium]